MSGGIYDCLGAQKQVGDMAITDAKINEYYTATWYCPKDGSFKGTNINLSMPGGIYAFKIRYVDLEVDVCILPRGDVRVIDQEMLQRTASEGLITERLLDIARAKVDEILASSI